MILHYVFGMAADFGGKPWSWIHYQSVRTAVAVNRPDAIYFWHEHEPTGPWWDAARPHLTLRKIDAPREIHGRELVHPAHRADVVRLRAVHEHGGVYIDSDVWCLRPFADLGAAGFWMGRQGANYGLCNATFGGPAGSPFLARWLASYSTFRSRGRDQHWDEHSVRVPLRLAEEHPGEITIFPYTAFFYPEWSNLQTVFRRRRPGAAPLLADAFSVHLWESICWNWLSRLDDRRIDPRSEIGERLAEIGCP